MISPRDPCPLCDRPLLDGTPIVIESKYGPQVHRICEQDQRIAALEATVKQLSLRVIDIRCELA